MFSVDCKRGKSVFFDDSICPLESVVSIRINEFLRIFYDGKRSPGTSG